VKYLESRLKAVKARNEYILCLEAANAAMQKYFNDDMHDLINVCFWHVYLLCLLSCKAEALRMSSSGPAVHLGKQASARHTDGGGQRRF